MLMLGRKIGESIIIDDNIEVKIVEINKGGVKLGIEAPKNKQILRSELKSAVEKTNKEATNYDKPSEEELLLEIYNRLKK